jgi:hypothetical protein
MSSPAWHALERCEDERDMLRVENARLTEELRTVAADLKPLLDAMQAGKYLAESWGQNVCEWAARELIELRADNARLWTEVDRLERVIGNAAGQTTDPLCRDALRRALDQA